MQRMAIQEHEFKADKKSNSVSRAAPRAEKSGISKESGGGKGVTGLFTNQHVCLPSTENGYTYTVKTETLFLSRCQGNKLCQPIFSIS